METRESIPRLVLPTLPPIVPQYSREKVLFDRFEKSDRFAKYASISSKIFHSNDSITSFFLFFFLSLSPVIAAIYYNRGIIAKVRYFKYHTLGGIGGGNSRP